MRSVLLLLLFAPGDENPTNPIAGSRSIAGSPYVPSQEEPPPTPLQRALNDMEPRGAWHYDDLDAGLAEATKSGKPLCVVFR